MYGAALFPIRLLDSSFSITMVKTWLKVGSAGVGVETGLGVGLPVRVGVGVACAELAGRGVGVPPFAAPDGDAELDGASATDGGVIDPAFGGASSSEVVHKSNAATPPQRTSRRKNHMGGTPPTLY